MCFLSQLIGIKDGYLSLLQDSGDVREDLKIPEGELGKEIENKNEAGEEILVSTAPFMEANAWDHMLSLHQDSHPPLEQFKQVEAAAWEAGEVGGTSNYIWSSSCWVEKCI